MRIALDGVTVRLGGRTILSDIAFSAEPGRFVGILGPNGSGKSTLLRTMYRAVRPAAGSVRIGELDVWSAHRRDVARTVAVMTQDSSTEFDFTALEVVLLGRVPFQRGFGRDSASDLEFARAALEQARASEFADRPLAELSGGQRQRVLLARALAAQTPVVLLDEPTNHLDIAFQLELMRLASTLDRTVIAALHDLNLAAGHCDAVVVLHQGRVVAAGPPSILTPALVREVFGVHAERFTHPRSGAPVLAFGHEDPAPREEESRFQCANE